MKSYRKAVPSFLPPEATCSDKSSITLSMGASNRAPTPFPPQLRSLSSSQKWPQQGSPPPAPPPTQLRTLPDRGAAFNLSVLYETPIRPSSKQRCQTSASLAPGHVSQTCSQGVWALRSADVATIDACMCGTGTEMGTGLSLVMASADNLRHKGIMTANGCARVAVEVNILAPGFPGRQCNCGPCSKLTPKIV
jgi:hypothetical protein